MEIFWKTIGLYNAATWEWQLGIILIGIILTVLLTRNPQPWVKNGMKIYLIAVYLWISVIYYYIPCRAQLQRSDGLILGDHGDTMGVGCLVRIHHFRTYPQI